MTVTPKEKCPCGGKAIVEGAYKGGTAFAVHHRKARGEYPEHYVQGPIRSTRESAIRAWDAMIRKWREKGSKA
jgi:hypothetical protein